MDEIFLANVAHLSNCLDSAGGYSIFCVISYQMHFGSGAWRLGEISQVSLVAARGPLVANHFNQETSDACTYFFYYRLSDTDFKWINND